MANLPDELINEVLLWLPVKSLLRFKCVSKSYCAIIGSRSFINSHFKRSSENGINHKLIELGRHKAYYHCLKVHAFDSNNDFQQELVLEKHCPFGLYRVFFSYCNGLVLLSLSRYYLSIWNPSTRKYRILPGFPFGLDNTCNLSFGLGYDSTSDDYKAVVIISDGSDISQVWVFGLRSTRWRIIIQDFSYIGNNRIRDGGNGDAFVDGALHFTCHFQNDSITNIVGFDVAKETFSAVSEPIHRNEGFRLRLHVLGRCLSAIFLMRNSELLMDIYVRKKDGIGFSWTRIYYSSVTKALSVEAYGRFIHGKFTHSKEGDKVFLSSNGNLCLYDLKEKSLREIVEIKDNNHLEIFSCTESLASVGSQDEEI